MLLFHPAVHKLVHHADFFSLEITFLKSKREKETEKWFPNWSEILTVFQDQPAAAGPNHLPETNHKPSKQPSPPPPPTEDSTQKAESRTSAHTTTSRQASQAEGWVVPGAVQGGLGAAEGRGGPAAGEGRVRPEPFVRSYRGKAGSNGLRQAWANMDASCIYTVRKFN